MNRLLESVAGIPLSIHSLDDCVPSLWVALTESLFDIKLAGIYKSHQHLAQGKKQDQENINKAGLISNSRLVLDTLSELLELDLSHLSAEALANGNPQESKFLIDILYQLAGLMGKVQDEVESVGEQDAGPPTIVAAIGEGEYDFDINEINDQGSYVEDDDYSGVEEGEDLEPQQQNSLATIDFEGQASPTPSTTTSSSIDHPSAQRRKRKTFVREVVEGDVTEFALEQEKRKATLRKPSTTETTEKAATASASQTRPKKKTRFNLKVRQKRIDDLIMQNGISFLTTPHFLPLRNLPPRLLY